MKLNMLMGKNIIDNCEYYGYEDAFYVYNKKEDWYIAFERGLSSTESIWEKSCDITLYTNIVAYGHNWKYEFEDYGFDKEKVLSQEEFLKLVNENLQIK